MKKTDLSYTAGIIDGEGWINIAHRGFRQTVIHVGVGNTNEWLINWLQFSYGGSVAKRKPCKDGQKPSWVWDISSKKAGEFLNLVLPYLQIKRPQAELALKFQNRRKSRITKGVHGILRMTDAEVALDEADKTLMHSYNKRGIS